MSAPEPQTAAESEARAALQAAVEGLYQTFAFYPLRPHVEGCMHCVRAEDEARLHSKPVRELTAGDLDTYALKAMTTWGDENDFRHFLPRLFELLAFEPSGLTLPDALVRRLERAEWRKWPVAEQTAVECFFASLWRHALACWPWKPGDWTAGECLSCIAQAVDELRPCLRYWQQCPEMSARYHLAEFVGCSYDMEPEHLLYGFEGRPTQMHQVIDWFLEPATLAALEPAFEQAPPEILPELTEARERLTRWQRGSMREHSQ